MPRHNRRLADVSRLVGAPPAYCEPLDPAGPATGIVTAENRPDTVVASVRPGSPAAAAGLRPGDRIFAVAAQTLKGPEELLPALRTHGRAGVPLKLDTSRGTIVVTPRIPEVERCYWQLPPGQIVWMGGAAPGHPSGAAGGAGAANGQPFFWASCRAHDGIIVDCQADWRE
jgi:membrane-associated protease RseP (regulator of RpoE activity)